MIPFAIPETAMKQSPRLSFQGGANDLGGFIESDGARVFSTVLDVLATNHEDQKTRAQNTDSIDSPPCDIELIVQDDATDAPTLAIVMPVTSDASVAVAKHSPPDLIVRPETGKSITFAQTIIEGRLPSPSLSGSPTVPDSPPAQIPSAGNETATLAGTESLEKVMQASEQKQNWKADPSPPAAPLPVHMTKRPLPDTVDPQGSKRDGVLPDLPKTQVIPSALAHQTALANAHGFDASLRSEKEKSGSLILGKEVAADVVPLSAPAERAVTALQHQTSSAAPVNAGAETARHVANQIAVAISGQQARATEIALNPEELGRVRLTMTAVDQTITLNIVADRPETIDLMRRHIDSLAQEFRALGYDNIAFSFGGDRKDTAGDRNGAARSGDAIIETENADINTITQQHNQSGAGLDLRL